MSTEAQPSPTARDQTDVSLKDERDKTDQKLKSVRDTVDSEADRALQNERSRADQAQSTARATEDEGAVAHLTLQAERRQDDRILRRERASADALVDQEREQGERVLEGVLARERAATDERLKEERAESTDAVETRETFLAVVSHDLRTLLAAMSLQAALLSRGDAAGTTLAQVVAAGKKLYRLTARMDGLVGDLLDVARIEAGKVGMETRNRPVEPPLREVVETFRPVAEDRGIALMLEPLAPGIRARFEDGRLFQVLGNLVGNALKFTPRGGQVTVGAQVQGTLVRCCVKDTGCGVSPAVLSSIFERHWQRTPGHHGGLGLGLYIAHSIVEAHGGTLWVEQPKEGGSLFCFTVPRA